MQRGFHPQPGPPRCKDTTLGKADLREPYRSVPQTAGSARGPGWRPRLQVRGQGHGRALPVGPEARTSSLSLGSLGYKMGMIMEPAFKGG